MGPYVLMLLTLVGETGQSVNWIGQKAVTKYTVPLKVNDKIVDEGAPLRIYTVRKIDGDSLWLEAEGVGGWVSSSDVVLHNEAIDFYTHEIDQDPLNGAAYGIRGGFRIHQGQYSKAIADYDESIRLNPTAWVAYENRGYAWMGKGDYDKGIADCTQALRLCPTSALAHRHRGCCWSAKGESEKAMSDFSEAIRLDPRDAVAYYNRGRKWGQKEEYDNAIADFDEAIRIDPRYGLALCNRAMAWRKKKEYDKAIADFNEAIRLDPNYAPPFWGRGSTWDQKGEYERALADYGEAIRLDPNDKWAYKSAAWLLATCPDVKCRDGKRAVKFARRSGSLTSWKNAESMDVLAAAYAESGDFDQAVATEQQAIRLADEDNRTRFESRLTLYQERKPYRQEP